MESGGEIKRIDPQKSKIQITVVLERGWKSGREEIIRQVSPHWPMSVGPETPD